MALIFVIDGTGCCLLWGLFDGHCCAGVPSTLEVRSMLYLVLKRSFYSDEDPSDYVEIDAEHVSEDMSEEQIRRIVESTDGYLDNIVLCRL